MKARVNPKSTSNQSSKPCTVLQYPSKKHEELSESLSANKPERWGAGVETPKNARGEIGGWGRVPFNEPYALSLNTIYDGA